MNGMKAYVHVFGQINNLAIIKDDFNLILHFP